MTDALEGLQALRVALDDADATWGDLGPDGLQIVYCADGHPAEPFHVKPDAVVSGRERLGE